MAFIPDEAIDRMTELSAGAWRLYCFLARCRNQKTGRCFPSVQVTMETIGTKRRQTFELRKELAQAGWARFEGNNVLSLLGFESAKNRTPNVEPEQFGADSAKNRTEPGNSAENRTPECRKSHSTVRKIALAYKEEPAKEPANITSKGKARQSAAVPVAIAFIRQLTNRFPDKSLWPRIVQTLGEDFDKTRLTECYENWVSHGWNKMNLVWLFEWYVTGISPRTTGNGPASKRNPAAYVGKHQTAKESKTVEIDMDIDEFVDTAIRANDLVWLAKERDAILSRGATHAWEQRILEYFETPIPGDAMATPEEVGALKRQINAIANNIRRTE